MATLDCQSHSCYFAVDKSGQRNNGPCRCLRDDVPAGLLSVIRMTVQAKVNQEQERCAKIANEKRSFSMESNPSDADRGWKRCAKAIEDEIRRS